MAHTALIAGLSAIIAGSAAVAQPEPAQEAGAPAAPPDALYCLKTEAVTGTRLEDVQCWTREQWAEQDVDLDKEWAKEGVSVIRA
jgi:hypothetical protein